MAAENEAVFKQSRIWGFTLNNYTPGEITALKGTSMEGIMYMCFQTEVCPTTGTPHLQGMWQFPGRGRRFNGVKSLPGMERANLQAKSRGAWVNKCYCSKMESRAVVDYQFFEIGESPKPQGSRSDIAAMRKVIKETGSMRAAIDVAASYQSIRIAEICLKYTEAPERGEMNVRWFWGPTGTGKTRAAYAEAGPDKWVSSATLQWWDGYDGHKNIIIDDYRRNACTFVDLLKILDRYSYRVPIKGGMLPLLATNIWITAPKPPQVMWEGRTDEELGQLVRRIREVREFKAAPEPCGPAPQPYGSHEVPNGQQAHRGAEPPGEPQVGGNTAAPTWLADEEKKDDFVIDEWGNEVD